jgi:hypothetical protein
MTTHDHTGATDRASVTLTLTLGGAAEVRTELHELRLALDDLRAELAALHYGLAAHLVRHGLHQADDLAIHEVSGQALVRLDRIREDVTAVARRLTLGERSGVRHG